MPDPDLIEQLRIAVTRAEDSGTSRAELARRSGVSEAMISRLMSGKRSPGIEVVEKIAAALGYRVTLSPRW